MHPNPRRIAPIVVIILVLLASVWGLTRRSSASTNGDLTASGAIETTQVKISPELGGRVLQVNAAEGEPVTAGQVLVAFDSALLNAQRAQAETALQTVQAGVAAAEANLEAAQSAATAAQAAVDAAGASLDLLETGAPEQQIQAASAALAQAEANLSALQANLAALTSASRPEEVTGAYASLIQARTEYEGMQVVLTDEQVEKVATLQTQAQDNLAQAQEQKELLAGISELPAGVLDSVDRSVLEASLALESASAALKAVEENGTGYAAQIQSVQQTWELAQRQLSLARARLDYVRFELDAPQEALDAAEQIVDDVTALEDAAEAAYQELTSGYLYTRLQNAWREVQDAQTTLSRLARQVPGSTVNLETLLNQIQAAQAVRDAAAANLALLESGSRQQQIAAAQAQVKAAEAQLSAAEAHAKAAQAQLEMAQAQAAGAQAAVDTLDVQLAKLQIAAPVDGVVLSRNIEPGEVAPSGATLLVLGILDNLTITVYLPEDRYGEIRLGQSAQVQVDSYPGESFAAEVVHIADQAEFTPRNVQTAEGRRTTVFAVRLKINVDDGKLKPGMPADVSFAP
jgi:multidrug resistance efflux pump